MGVFSAISDFFSFLSFVDVVFLIAVILLLILIVTLIYFVRINKDVFDKSDNINSLEINNNVPVDMNNDVEEIKNEAITEEYNDEDGELLDLESLTKKLEEEKEHERINFTEYEKDQEEKAIISYDELLQKKNKYAINYEKEEMIDDLLIKKVNLNDLENKDDSELNIDGEVRVISYQKEEAFLSALKELNSLLN